MQVKLLGARTGQGHISALNAVKDEFCSRGVEALCYPTFYEDASICNEILSDFNNLLAMKSQSLSIELNELYILEGTQINEKRYKSYLDYFSQVLSNNEEQIIISFTPLINKYIIKFIAENCSKTKFYIVVTDPYEPMYPGFESCGADGYFCPSQISKRQLLKFGVPEAKAVVTGFPLQKKFLIFDYDLDTIRKHYGIPNEKLIMINCGSYGNPLYFSLISDLLAMDSCFHYLIICGNNRILKMKTQHYIDSNNVNNAIVFDYVDNINELLAVSSVCITKGGANFVHECIACGVIPLIAGFWGLQYQERGVINYLIQNYGLEIRFNKPDDLIDYLMKKNIKDEQGKLNKMGLDGASNIVKNIICENTF